MIDLVSPAIVLIAGFFLVGLGLVSLATPALAGRFLLGFASSPGLHYIELGLRLAVGGALLLQAPVMRFSLAVTIIGWALVLTTVGLALIPWQWHRRFAQQTVPRALRFLPLMGAVSLAFGGFVLFSLFGAAT